MTDDKVSGRALILAFERVNCVRDRVKLELLVGINVEFHAEQ